MSTPGTSSRSSVRSCFEDLVAPVADLGIHAQDVFARVHGLGVLVQLGAAGAADEVQDLAVRILRRRLQLAELGVDQLRDADWTPPATSRAAA